MARLVFLTSGYGGDYFALEKARLNGLIAYSTEMIISTIHRSAAIEDAAEKGYPNAVIPVDRMSREDIDRTVQKLIAPVEFDWAILAGYRYLVPKEMVNAYPRRIINSHHSILPGNPGLFSKERLVKSDNKLLGATVHYVDTGIDTGEIICQGAFPNYGINVFEKILHRYRQIQDVLMVTAVMRLTKREINSSQATTEDSVFWPAPDKSVLKLFFD